MKSIKYGRVYGKTFAGEIIDLNAFNPYLPSKHFDLPRSIYEEFNNRMLRHKYAYGSSGAKISGDLMKEIETHECRDIIKIVVRGENMFLPQSHALRAARCDEIIADIDDLSNITPQEFADIIKTETDPALLMTNTAQSFGMMASYFLIAFILIPGTFGGLFLFVMSGH